MGLPVVLTENAWAANTPDIPAMTDKAQLNLYLELVLNGRPTGHVAPVL